MKNKLTDVLCTYTGGNIYVITAKLNDVYLATDIGTYGTYDVPYDDIEEKYDVTATWDNYVSITPLQFDYTAHDMINKISSWDITLKSGGDQNENNHDRIPE